MTTTWNLASLCRICSSPADYEIFARIPNYLHSNSNEFLSWQKPINILLEETTGLKISADDGLPHNICALCISYLKHAANFRDQVIKNSMSLKAVQMLEQKNQKKNKTIDNVKDKESLLITAQDLNYAEERQMHTNLLINNSSQQESDKVCKQLLNNNFQRNNAATQQNIEQQIRYLNLLFDKDTNAGLKPKHRNGASAAYEAVGSGGDEFAEEEEFPTTTSSEDNDDGGVGLSSKQKHNIFSYREKNFEEDDIMDMDELRDVITINIPESCKERKCRACSRRFMFEDSYKEHMDTCIEYRFLTFIEEINRLLDIRRNKAVSPHEFIRRMIFCLRKTCEWLKSNCIDMLMPDLMHNNNGSSETTSLQKHLESEGNKSSSSGEQKALIKTKTAAKFNEVFHDTEPDEGKMKKKALNKRTTESKISSTNKSLKNLLLTDANSNAAANAANKKNVCDIESGSAKSQRTPPTTPINITNNILYEIERSQSRNSQKRGEQIQQHYENTRLMKPIAVLATNITTTTKTTATFNINNAGQEPNTNANAEERLTFLQKLQQAACQTPTTAPKEKQQQQKRLHKEQIQKTPKTPSISVRKDLLPSSERTPSAALQPLVMASPSTSVANLTFSARCNSCNLIFETLASLEVHNAMHHNNLPKQNSAGATTVNNTACDDEERKRIIALFEEGGL